MGATGIRSCALIAMASPSFAYALTAFDATHAKGIIDVSNCIKSPAYTPRQLEPEIVLVPAAAHLQAKGGVFP